MDDLSNLPIPLDKLPIDLNFSLWAILAGLLFSSAGLWLFRHGKRNENKRNLYSGVVLMVYPYFVSTALWTWVIGLIISGYVYYWWD